MPVDRNKRHAHNHHHEKRELEYQKLEVVTGCCFLWQAGEDGRKAECGEDPMQSC